MEVLKSTSASVYPVDSHGRRARMRGDWENYFPTRDEALKFILDGLSGMRDHHLNQAQMFRDAIAKAQA